MAFDPDKYLESKKAPTATQSDSSAPLPALDEDKLSIGDLAAMLGQGATLNFGDELMGALKAGTDVATGKGSLDQILDLYRQHQKEEEAKYEALKEAHPNLAFAGELAGGFLVPGGLVAKGVGEAAKGATTLEAILAAAKGGAKIGAVAGAGSSKADVSDLGALGKDVLGGAVGGAALGGTLSAAGQGISKGIPSLIAKAEQADTPLIRNLAAAARKGFEGKKLLSDTAQKEIEEESQGAASQLEKSIEGTRKEASEDITKVLESAKEKGALVNPDEDIKEGLALLGRNLKSKNLVTPTIDAKTAKKIATIENKVKSGKLTRVNADEEIKKLHATASGVAGGFEKALSAAGTDVSKTPHEMQGTLDKLTSLVKGELSPQEAYNLALDLEKFDPELLPPKLAKMIKTAAKGSADVVLAPEMEAELNNQLASLQKDLNLGNITQEEFASEAAKLKSQYSSTPATRAFDKEEDIKSKLAESLLNEGRHPDYQNKQLRDLGFSAPQKIYDVISKKIIEKLSDPSTTGDDARLLITTLEKNIQDLNTKYPEMNLDFSNIINRIKNVSQDVTLRKKILSEQGKTDAAATGVMDKLMNLSGYGGAYASGILAGKGAAGMAKFNNLISTAGDTALMPVAKALQGVKGVSHLGAALEGALNNKSIAAKNAAIFSIMQNPEARKAAAGVLPGIENE